MPRRKDSRNLSIQLTPAQYTAVQVEASRRGQDIAAFVRDCLSEQTPGFTDGIARRGTYDRRRQFVALCIGDDDVVTFGDAQAWLETWHRDDAGNDVPATYNLSTDGGHPRQFETLRELLDAMAEIAPFDQWRVEDEE